MTRPYSRDPQWQRGASEDLWKRTLSQIPTIFGRLVYMAGLRNTNSGRYEHHGLQTVFGDEEASTALRDSHQVTWRQWLVYDLEEQQADLDLYFSSLDSSRERVLETWVRLTPYRHLIPDSASESEIELYMLDLETLLQLLRDEYRISSKMRED
jgi:hypothetical protein